MSHNFIDLTGQKFGRLTVIQRVPKTGRGNASWACKCDCGVELVRKSSNLRGGKNQSCGCHRVKDRTGTHGYRVRFRRIDGKNLCFYEHIEVAEKALGHPLPPKAIVHHVNEDPLDNRPSNLVICPNQAYHLLIHQRTAAYDACGHADWLKCCYCKQYDDPQNLRIYSSFKSGIRGRHVECQRTYSRNRARELARNAKMLHTSL